MSPPSYFKPAGFAYLNVQRAEPHHDTREELVCTTSSNLNEAEEFLDGYSHFIYFAQLPLELQRRIWYFAALSPRVVEVHRIRLHARTVETLDRTNSKFTEPQRDEITHFRSKTEDPPLLRACIESRDVALRMYKRADLASEYCADSVYFELRCDTLFLSRQMLELTALGVGPPLDVRSSNQFTRFPPNMGSQGRAVHRDLHSLAFDASVLLRPALNATSGYTHMVPHPWACRPVALFLSNFQALEEVILVLNEDGLIIDGKSSSIQFQEPTSGSDTAALLQEAATLLSTEYQKEVSNREAQAEHVARNICMNLGAFARPLPLPPPTKRMTPVVRTMVTK